MELFEGLWAKLRGPLGELLAHFVITVITILSIAGIELLLSLLHNILFSGRVQVVGVSLADWMFGLDVLAATLINLVGIYRALKKL